MAAGLYIYLDTNHRIVVRSALIRSMFEERCELYSSTPEL